MCLLRNIEELFCFPDSAYKDKDEIDPIVLYGNLQTNLFTKLQDLVFAVNVLNDEFYDEPMHKFLDFVMKEFELHKFADARSGVLFAGRRNIIKVFNSPNEGVSFQEDKSGFGRDQICSINPNYIVLETRQSKKNFLRKVEGSLHLPSSHIIRVIQDLGNYSKGIRPFKEIKTQFYVDVQEGNRYFQRREKIETISVNDLKYVCREERKFPLFSEDYSDRNNYKMVFNIHCFNESTTYQKSQFDVMKNVILSLTCYENSQVDKLILLNEERGNYEILNVSDAVERRKKLLHYRIEVEQNKNKDVLNQLNEKGKQDLLDKIEMKYRRKVQLQKNLYVKNILKRNSNSGFLKKDQNSLKQGSFLNNIFSNNTISFDASIDEFNGKIHQEMLDVSKK